MSVDYNFHCMIAVRIDIDSMCTAEERLIDQRCDHVKKLTKQPKFCPICGEKVIKPKEERIVTYKNRYIKMFDEEEDYEEYPFWEGRKFEYNGYKIKFIDMNDQNQKVLCGVSLGESGNHRECRECFIPGIPKYPTKDELRIFLKKHGIKAIENTYGLYSWVKVT